MRIRVMLVSAALLMSVAACNGDAEPDVSPTPTPVETTTASTEPPTNAPPKSSADLELAPGRIGPVDVGISKDDAMTTGLFDADLDNGPCDTPGLTWKKQFTGVDVLTDSGGSITSLGVGTADGPRTADGKGVGSTFGELIEAYGGDLSAPETAGFGQVGVFVRDGDDWLGFLLGEATTVEQVDNDPAFEVTFAEATKFAKPALIRDGC